MGQIEKEKEKEKDVLVLSHDGRLRFPDMDSDLPVNVEQRIEAVNGSRFHRPRDRVSRFLSRLCAQQPPQPYEDVRPLMVDVDRFLRE